jgi:ferredoxin
MSRDLLAGGEVVVRTLVPEDIISMPKVAIANEKREIEVDEGANLREALRAQGVPVYSGIHRLLNCHGFGLCGSCNVLVKKGMENLAPKGTSKEDWQKQQEKVKQAGPAAAPRTGLERLTVNTGLLMLNPLPLLKALGNEEEMRLSCQLVVYGDCTVETTPGFNWHGENFWQKPFPNK